MIKDKIKEAEIDGEKVYLRKDMFGWRVINPVKVDGKINLKNLILGNRKVIIFTILWLLIMGAIIYGVNEMVSSCRDMTKNPCNYFNIDCSNRLTNDLPALTFGGEKNEP